MDDLTVIVSIEDGSSTEGLTVTGINTADEPIGLMRMNTVVPFMFHRPRLSMCHRHRRRALLFFSLPSLFAEGCSSLGFFRVRGGRIDVAF